VVHGVVDGKSRGWLFDGVSVFIPDDAGESSLSGEALRAMAATTPLTFTCAPPGSGMRMALDRDEDGTLNQDDDDPASRPFIAIPNPSLPPLPETPEDGGLEPDGGEEKSGSSGGCGCSTAQASFDSLWLALLALGFVGLRLRRRVA
jgi:MYXO-CTERM domain-containing protein